ncbi:MAG: sulfatase family protein [Planctomycetota bacterium]|jgi:arylsulfatase A-like enzyme
MNRAALRILPPALVAALAAMLAPTAGLAAGKPNLVVIFIDDMGYGDIGPYGSTLNRTPNLDRMATEGMMLTSFYAAPVCSASRAQIMTGCYAPRVSVPGVFFPAGPRGLNPKEHTVAEYLREAGYATMCVGKWHLGDQVEFLPTRQGFDGYLGIPYSNDMGRKSLEDGRSVHPLVRDDKVAELLENEDQRRITREYTEEAVRFITANANRPFFLYLPHTAMHVPLFPHRDFAGKSRNGTYGDWVEEVDWSVGQVLDTLKRLGVERNTFVLFTSDNGPWASKGKAGSVSGPLRGSKGCTLEGGVREPTIAWWPGRIRAGSRCDAVAGTTDVLPTLVALGGGRLRADVKIDGCDISPILFGATTESPHEAWYYYRGTQLEAVRSGPWKLAIKPQSLGMGIRERPADLRVPGRLYNLDDEIGEVTNVAARHPDVVARLQKLADGMVADIGSGRAGPGVRPAGHVADPVTLFPTQQRGRGAKPAGKPLDWDKIKIGDAYRAASAPAIAGKAFTIRCEIDAQKPNGVILAHGGSAVGYSLYAKNGKIVFAARHGADSIRRVESRTVAAGVTRIRVGLDADGTIRLVLNETEPVTAKTGGPLAKHPQEDLCIGHDSDHPLDTSAPAQRFNGAIRSARVVVGGAAK